MNFTPKKSTQQDKFSSFRETMLCEGKKDLELLQLTNEQAEVFIKSLYYLGDHLIDQSLEKNII